MVPLSAEARAVHDAALIVDLHCDLLIPTRLLGWDWGRRHARNPLPGAPLFGHVDLPRLREGNVGCLALGVVVAPWFEGRRAVARELARMHAQVRAHPDALEVCGTAQAVRGSRSRGRIACFAGLEGAHGLEGRLDDLPFLREAGLRYVGLAHFTKNEACRPMVGWGADNAAPLTDFGRELVDALGDLGLLVDLAHVGRAAAIEAARRARGPVLVSHTACTAVHASPRGIDDDVIRAVADTDGVVGVIFVEPFIGRGGIAQVVRHLEHLRRTVGVRHAALGTDWEGFALYPRDLAAADQLPALTEALLRAGWSAEEIHAVYGENFLRVMGVACDG